MEETIIYYEPYVIARFSDGSLKKVTNHRIKPVEDPNEALEVANRMAEDVRDLGGGIIMAIGIDEAAKIEVEANTNDATNIKKVLKRLKVSDLADLTNGKTVEIEGGYGYLLPGPLENGEITCGFFFEKPDHWDDERCLYVDENGEEVGLVDEFTFRNIPTCEPAFS